MWRTEPALIVSTISALLVLLVATGTLSGNLQQPIEALVAELVALIVASGLIIRSQVSPVN